MSTASQAMHKRALVGTKYRIYKRATDKLAAWLATTAQLDVGKGRQSLGSTHGLTIAQFISLTDQIIEMTPRVEVPQDILNTAEKVFLLRQERSVILGGVDAESDIRHQYVVAVMAEVFQKLTRHHQAPRQVLKSDTATDCRKEEQTLSSFQLLAIEAMESSEDDSIRKSSTMTQSSTNKHRNMKKKMLKKKKKSRQQASKAYLLDVDEDRYFVLMCLLSDLKSMRGYIKEVWQEYRDGKVDLITASLTTNATFDIIRTYQDDFPAITTLLNDYSEAVRMILLRHLPEADEGLASFFKPCTKLSDFNQLDIETIGQSLSTIPEVAESIFASAFYFLHGPRHSIVQWKGSTKWEDMHTNDEKLYPFGKYRPEQDRNKLTTAERLQQDVQILASFAKHVYLTKEKEEEFSRSTWDHVTLQWRNEFAKTGDKIITLAQAFGAQLYLDIHHTLREDAKHGLFDLFKGALNVAISFNAWKDNTPQDIWETQKEVEQAYINLDVTYTSVCRGLIFKMLDLIDCDRRLIKLRDSDEDTIKLALEAFPFLQMNPLLCGIILFETVHSHRDEGTFFAQMGGAFLFFAGQIYYGCKMQREYWKSATNLDEKGRLFKRQIDQRWKTPLPKWEDMEYMFELFGVDTFFDEFLPKTSRDISNYYGPLKDVFLINKWWETWSNRKSDGHFGPILTAPTREDHQIKFARLIYNFEPILFTHRLYYSKYFKFKNQEIDKTPVYDWTLETLQILLENHLKAKKEKSDGGNRVKSKGKTAFPLLKDDNDGNVSQVTILRTLKEVLQSESRALNFDFLYLHTICYRFLLALRDEAGQIILMYDPFTFYLDDRNVVRAAGGIQALVNNPDTAGLGPHSYCTEDKSFCTNPGHYIIDESVRKSLVETDWKDYGIKKLTSIWGIPPA